MTKDHMNRRRLKPGVDPDPEATVEKTKRVFHMRTTPAKRKGRRRRGRR